MSNFEVPIEVENQAEAENPVEQLVAAQDALQKVEDDQINFDAYAQSVMKRFGKRIQDFDEAVPEEKAFIDEWDAQEKRYREDSARLESEINRLSQVISPLGRYQPGIALKAQQEAIGEKVAEFKQKRVQ